MLGNLCESDTRQQCRDLFALSVVLYPPLYRPKDVHLFGDKHIAGNQLNEALLRQRLDGVESEYGLSVTVDKFQAIAVEFLGVECVGAEEELEGIRLVEDFEKPLLESLLELLEPVSVGKPQQLQCTLYRKIDKVICVHAQNCSTGSLIKHSWLAYQLEPGGWVKWIVSQYSM